MQIIIQCQKETRELANDRRSTRLSGRKYDKTLQEFAKYLRKLLEGKTAQDIARDTGYPYSKAETAFNKSYIPTCDLMKRLIEVYDNGNYETLRELSNNNIKLLYEYWSLIYPTAEPLDRLGFVIRSIVMEKKLDRATVVKNVGITQPRYSNVINGKSSPANFSVPKQPLHSTTPATLALLHISMHSSSRSSLFLETNTVVRYPRLEASFSSRPRTFAK